MIFRLLKTKQKHVAQSAKQHQQFCLWQLFFSILLDWRQIYSKSKSHKNVFFNILLETILQKLIQWKIFGCWQSVRIFRELKTVKISNKMPNWRRQINKIDRQYSPQIRAFLKGMTSPKLILMLEIESIWSNRHHIAGGIYNFYEDLR